MRKFFGLFLLLAAITFSTSPASASIARISQVAPGIWRSSQPTTPADFATLAQMGIKLIVDLQWDDPQYTEEKSWADANHLIDLHYPMGGDYPDEQKVGEILALMKDAAKNPILIHCQAGQDRTGLVVALYRVHVMGWSTEKARDEMLALGYHWYYLHLETYWQLHSTQGSQLIPEL